MVSSTPPTVLEALACGRPVVASRVGGIPEVMDETCGALIPAGDAKALAEAISRTLGSSWDPQALARRVAGLSWEANASALGGILAEAARESS